MRAFQSTYIGRHDFRKSLPEVVLRRWFTFDVRDRSLIRKTFRSRYWISAALQLGFVGMTGTTLRSIEYVPASVLRHLGKQFRQPAPEIATLRALYRRRPTRFEHQRWAIQHCGLREFDTNIEQRLTDHIRARTHATLSRGRLEQAAREWLYKAYVTIPRRRVIRGLVRGVIQAVAVKDHQELRRYMREERVRVFLRDLLFHHKCDWRYQVAKTLLQKRQGGDHPKSASPVRTHRRKRYHPGRRISARRRRIYVWCGLMSRPFVVVDIDVDSQAQISLPDFLKHVGRDL